MGLENIPVEIIRLDHSIEIIKVFIPIFITFCLISIVLRNSFFHKNYVRKILQINLLIISCVLLTLIVLGFVLFIGYYLFTRVDHESQDIGVLNLSSTIVLTIVTLVYVLLTYSIVTESRNWNRVQFITSKLEKFYYPLSQQLGDYHKTVGREGTEKFWALLEEKSSFLYLTDNKEIKEIYAKLIAYKRKFKVDKDLDDVVILRDTLIELVDKDIDKLEGRLNELTK